MRPHLPDLVKDSQLQAAFIADTTVHRFTSVDTTGRRIRYQEEWKIEKHLGQGSYGRVWKESCISDDSDPPRVRAVKMILKPQHPSRGFDYNRELEAIAKFSHAKYKHTFVRSMGWYESRGAIFIAMEFMAHGDLQKYMPDVTTQKFSVQETQDVVSQLVEGLFFLHDNDFSHRDLKPANVLVKSKPPDDEKWWVKIGDFGITKRAEDGNGPSTIKGTFGFMAPELLSSANSTGRAKGSFDAQPTDMWALGEITFRMLSGAPSFKDVLTLLRWMEKPTPDFLDQLKPLVGDEVIDFIQALLKADPAERLTARAALQHSWIDSHITSVELEPGPLLSIEQSWPQYPQDEDTFKFSEASAKWSTISQPNPMQGAISEESTLRPDATAKSKRHSLPLNDIRSTTKPTTPELPVVPPTPKKTPPSASVDRSDRPATASSSRYLHPTVEDYHSSDGGTDEGPEDPGGVSRRDPQHNPSNKQTHLSDYDTSSRSESEHGGVDLRETDTAQSPQVTADDFRLYQDTEKGFLLRPKKRLSGSEMENIPDLGIKNCPVCKADYIKRKGTEDKCSKCNSQFAATTPDHTNIPSQSSLSDDNGVETDSEYTWSEVPYSDSEWVQPDTSPNSPSHYKSKVASTGPRETVPPSRAPKETRNPRSLYGELHHDEPNKSTRTVPNPSKDERPLSKPKRERTSRSKRHTEIEDQARRAGIPAGYSLKNWDPNEEPLLLLGSVFDSNSLGKWVYDWTVYHYGVETPLSETAAELWLLLTGLAGRVKQAEIGMPTIRSTEDRELLEDFLKSGEELWIKLSRIIKVCEDFMWKRATKDNRKKPVNMGKESGIEFVDTIFGRDRELEKTEKFMTGTRLWTMRFDANCDDILKNSGAAVRKPYSKMMAQVEDARKYILKSKVNSAEDYIRRSRVPVVEYGTREKPERPERGRRGVAKADQNSAWVERKARSKSPSFWRRVFGGAT